MGRVYIHYLRMDFSASQGTGQDMIHSRYLSHAYQSAHYLVPLFSCSLSPSAHTIFRSAIRVVSVHGVWCPWAWIVDSLNSCSWETAVEPPSLINLPRRLALVPPPLLIGSPASCDFCLSLDAAVPPPGPPSLLYYSVLRRRFTGFQPNATTKDSQPIPQGFFHVP